MCPNKLSQHVGRLLSLPKVLSCLQGMRFGLTPDVCRQALNLSFELKQGILSSSAQQEAQQTQQQAQHSLQKVHATCA